MTRGTDQTAGSDLDEELIAPDRRRRSGHPWPQVGGYGRADTIEAAARDCVAKGYPLRHAAMALVDWNRGNRPPLGRDRVLEIVTKTYADASTPYRDLQALESLEALEPALARRWLIPGILPAGQRVGLTGWWGLGKSWLALDAAMSVAYGTSFLGTYAPSGRGNVVILDGEGGRRRASTRFRQIRRARHIEETGDLSYGVYWRAAASVGWGRPANSSFGVDSLIRQLETVRPRLVIFDTLAKVLGLPDENSNAAAARVTSALYRMSERLDATILVLSHPAKEGHVENVRGAGEFTADLDALLVITEGRDGFRRAQCVKDRDGDLEGMRFEYRIVAANGAVSPERITAKQQDLEEIVRRALVREGGSIRSVSLLPEVARELGKTEATARRGLKVLEQKGVVSYGGKTWKLTDRP